MHRQQETQIQNTNPATFKLIGQPASDPEGNFTENSAKQEKGFNVERSKISKLVDNGQDFGSVIPLAYYSNSQEVHIDQQTLYMLQKYSINQTCYLGFMGSQDSCRSFVLDTIVNLSSIEGNHFTQVYTQDDTPGIFIWSLPYSFNAKLKVFLIQCRGIRFEGQQLPRKDQILIDLMVILCSSIVLVGTGLQHVSKKIPIFKSQTQRRQGRLPTFQSRMLKQLYQSKQRIHFQGQASGKAHFYWPRSFYYFYGQKNTSMRIPNIQQLFHHCLHIHLEDPFANQSQSRQQLMLTLNDNLKGANPSFVKRVSRFFVDQLLSTYCKQNEGLKWNGNVVCKLLINTVKYMNKKNKIKLDKVLTSIAKELYQASFIYHSEIYENYLKQHLLEEQPFSFDSLLTIFRQAESQALTSFNEVVINEQTHNAYEQKLMAFIDQKEKMLIEINVKKTKSKVKDKIKQLNGSTSLEIESIRNYISCLSEIGSLYDHQTSGLFSAGLLKYTSNLQKRIIDQKLKIEKEKIGALKEQYRQLHQFIQTQRQTKEEIRRANRQNQKNHKKMLKQLSQLDNRLKNTRREIDNEKKYQKEYIITKQSKKNEAERLLELIREQEEKSRENLRIMEDIKKEYDYHPDILTLNKQIEEKERHNKQLQRLESKMELQSRLSPIPSQTQLDKPNTFKKIKKITVKR